MHLVKKEQFLILTQNKFKIYLIMKKIIKTLTHFKQLKMILAKV